MKKIMKMINLVLVLMIILSAILPTLCNLSLVFAADTTIEYHGKITYGYSTVGDFTVDGIQAFCIDHDSPTPPTGSEANIEIYNNEDMAKCLYYGWEGAEQWAGFTSREMGIVMTSLALDHFNNGSNYSDCKPFLDFLDTVGMPEIVLDFSNKNLTAYAIDNNTQRTNSTTVTGDPRYCLTINLQDGVTLVNETRGTESSGSVNVYGGDTFYLKAPLYVNGSWTSNNIDNCKYDFQPIIYRTVKSSLQDLAGGMKTVVDPTSTTNLSVHWVSLGNLVIRKVDAANNSINISNTVFDIFDSNNNLVDTITTNSEGVARLDNLSIGKYQIVEKQPNDFYILDNTPREVQINSDDNVITIENSHKKGNLVIKKVDAENNSVAIENTTFEVYNSSNKLVGTIKTNKQGIARLDNINVGTYKIFEVSTDEYYRLDSFEKTIDVKYAKESGDTNLTITNEQKKGCIEIRKYDKDAYENKNIILGVQDVVFGIFDEQGNKIEEIRTNVDGYAKSSPLTLMKNYIVKELKTRPEYILNTKEFKVNLTEYGIIDGYTYDLKVANEHKKGNLHIEKITLDDNTIQLAGVEFELYLVGDGEINLYIGTYYTDVNGEIYIRNLNTGKYMLKECKTNRWYYLADDKPIEIKWAKEYGDTNITVENEKKKGTIKVIKTDSDFINHPLENIKFNVYDEDNNFIETITTNANGIAESSRLRIDKKYYLVESETLKNYVLDDTIYTIDFTEGLTKDQINDIQTDTIKTLNLKNTHKKGNLLINKVDSQDNTKVIEGVIFELYTSNVDNPYTTNQLIGTYTTNFEGKIEIKDLWTGNYILKEIETSDLYQLRTDDIPVEIKYNNTTNLTIENERKKGQLKVIKVDKDNTEYRIPDVVFEILDSDNNIIETITTDENGEAISSMLPCIDETYYLRETKTGETYVLSDEIKEVSLTENEITNIIFENEKIKGKLQITKVDSKDSNKKLQNVVFGIYDENDNLIQEITTNENGIAISDDIIIGKYYCKELNTGSPYYLLNENTYEFEIKTNGEIIEKVIDNKPIEIIVDVDKEGTVEIKSGEVVDYTFKNVANNSNIYLDNFKWYDYIPTDYIRLEKMTTGTWNQDLIYNIYYKTNKSEDYILFKDGFSTQENYDLDFTIINLSEDEYITETCFDFGKVDVGFRESTSPTMKCKSFDTLNNNETFTNHTKTVGIYEGITAEANSKWTTIVHLPEEKHEVVLPRTGK